MPQARLADARQALIDAQEEVASAQDQHDRVVTVIDNLCHGVTQGDCTTTDLAVAFDEEIALINEDHNMF